MSVPYPVPPEPPGGRKFSSSSGPRGTGPQSDDWIENIQQFGSIFHDEAARTNARAEALEKAEEGRKLRDAAKARESEAMANLGAEQIDSQGRSTSQPQTSSLPAKGVVGNSPALSVNTVVGLVLGVVTLLGLTLNTQQNAAVIAVVSALFVIVPVLAGFIIRAINTRRGAQ